VTRYGRDGSIAALALLCGLLAAPPGFPTRVSAPRIVIDSPPSFVREPVTVSDLVQNPPPRATVALEQLMATDEQPASWHVAVRSTLMDHGMFRLVWFPSRPGPLTVRVVVRAGGRDVAVSAPRIVKVGQPPAYCNAAPGTPQNVPAGYGWLAGTLDSGAPGSYRCPATTAPYTIAVLDQAGNTVTTREIGARQSYALVVPQGSYTIKLGGFACAGIVTVAAGQPSLADVVWQDTPGLSTTRADIPLCEVRPTVLHICSGCGLPPPGPDLPLCKTGQASTTARPCSTI
jgi:hypothetical protein